MRIEIGGILIKMEILSFLYKKEIMYTIEFFLLILGVLLYLGMYRISREKISIILSWYCGMIFGSLLGFILSKNIVAMVLGAITCSIVFNIVDRILKNNGMFILSFISIFDTFYLFAMGVLYEFVDLVIPKDNRVDFEDKYFEINSYEIRNIVFVLSMVVAVIAGIFFAKKVKEMNVFYFMVTLFCVFRVFGLFWGSSYAIYPYKKVEIWEPVYLSILTLEYDVLSLFFLFIILIVTVLIYKIKSKNNENRADREV